MKTAVITGGSSGIGAATAREFVKAGVRVVIGYRQSEDKAAALCEELNRIGEAYAFRADMKNPDEVRELFCFAEAHGGTDILVNNAGISEIGVFQLMSNERIQEIIGVNLLGQLYAAKYAIPQMLKKHEGVIINVSSVWGTVGASCEVAYSASKAGVIGFTKALAKEVGESGIRVNCVAPGVIDTDMNRGLDKETLAELQREIPLGRIGTPEEAAQAILFLAGEKASYLNGITLGVDGGF